MVFMSDMSLYVNGWKATFKKTQVAQIVWPNLYSNIPDLDKFSERIFFSNKGNNKITELRTILQRESQNS
jgi:hypothetical protein